MYVIKFDEDNKDWVDKLFISLIHSTLFFIVIIHLLALVRVYETLSLVAVFIVSSIIVIKLNYKPKDVMTRVLTSSYDMLEHPNNWRQYVRGLPRRAVNQARMYWEHTVQLLRMNWFICICMTITLIFALYTRFKHSIIHTYFGSSDPYVHMQLSKFLGENKMFGDGIYPYGFAAIISALNKFFIMDTYIIVRFIGPIGGILIVLSIYYALRKIIGPYYFAIFTGVFLYAVYAGLPTNLWRQISALSMEYATIFLLPGITLLIQYFRSKHMMHLILAGECLAITLFIHVYSSVALTIAYIIICLCHWRLLIWKLLFRFIIVMMVSGVIGLLPLIIAFTLKSAEVGEFTYVTENIQTAQKFDISTWVSVFNAEDQVVRVLLIASVILLLLRAIVAVIRKIKGLSALNQYAENGLLFVFFVFYWIFASEKYGLPVVVPSDRFGVFFALSAALAVAVLVNQILLLLPKLRYKKLINSLLVLSFASVIIGSGNVNSVPVGSQYQYDDAVKTYLNIKKEFRPNNWTIVSPVEEYHLGYGYGWHTQIWEFVETLSNPQGKVLEIPTDDVFIFVEKIPLGSEDEITVQDEEAPFPEFTGSDLTEFYYRNEDNRRILQAKAYHWAESYMKNQEMTIYYDSPVLRVYWIQQDGLHPRNLLH
jgi:hypothetical protein